MQIDESEHTGPIVYRLADEANGGYGAFYATVSEADDALDEEVGSLVGDRIEWVMEENDGNLCESDCKDIAEDQIRSFVSVIEVDPTEVDLKGRTVLHGVDDLDSIHVLVNALPVEARADYVNTQDIDGRTALHEARSPEQAQALLDFGADSTLVDRKGQTAAETPRAGVKSVIERDILERHMGGASQANDGNALRRLM